jgi:hypothetical protein
MKSVRYACQILMKTGFSEPVFEEYSKIKFCENPSSGSELFHAEGRTDVQTEGPTDMTKLIVTSLNFANAPKNTHTLRTKINSVNMNSGLQCETNQTFCLPPCCSCHA